MSEQLSERRGPVIASTDYLRAVPDQIRQWVSGSYRTLGTDGYGRSDFRTALRRFFEVDRHYVAVAALKELADARHGGPQAGGRGHQEVRDRRRRAAAHDGMSATLTKVEVPDIGDFDDVPVIEILVSVGDSVAVEDPLVTLESDKATMDVPAPLAGVVREISVSVGDRVSQGSLLMSLEGSDGAGDPGGGEPAEQAAAADRAAEATTQPAESVEAPSQPAEP